MRVECPLEVSMQEPAAPVTKQDGVTDAERYLGRLGTRSFLSLWSYPGVYRNTGPAGGHGKEVCDLLVVFRDDIIIFSDKDCAFPDKGDLWVDWGRWYRKAILESANQVWGAERFIRTNPQRLFIDRACQRPFPIALPPQDQMRFHRVVVAHGTRKRCRAHLGGTGTLVLKPDIVGKAHYERDCEPFLIGDVDPTKGFVHVLDDISLDVVLGHLDTVADFIAYLTKKEAFYRSEKLALAGGEDDLLAYYLHDINDQEEHDFIYPAGTDAVVVEPGQWQLFSASQAYVRQQEANWVSGAWDALIEEFGKHILGGTSIASTHFSVEEQERAVRMLAAEGRTARRALGQSLFEIMRKTPPGKRSAARHGSASPRQRALRLRDPSPGGHGRDAVPAGSSSGSGSVLHGAKGAVPRGAGPCRGGHRAGRGHGKIAGRDLHRRSGLDAGDAGSGRRPPREGRAQEYQADSAIDDSGVPWVGMKTVRVHFRLCRIRLILGSMECC